MKQESLMVIDEHQWSSFIKNPEGCTWMPAIHRHPMTGKFAWECESVPIINLRSMTISERPVVRMEVPSSWFRPVTKEGRPPIAGKAAWAYNITLQGVVDNIHLIKSSFKSVADLAVFIADIAKSDKWYEATLHRRMKKNGAA